MQVRNIFGMKDIFTAITGNDLNAFCANVYKCIHAFRFVSCMLMCKYTKDYVPKLALLMCVQIHKSV